MAGHQELSRAFMPATLRPVPAPVQRFPRNGPRVWPGAPDRPGTAAERGAADAHADRRPGGYGVRR